MKLICIGRNYTKHIEELENEKPTDPVVFLKPDTAILLKKQPFFIPDFSNDVHHEVEILVKINKVGKYIEDNLEGVKVIYTRKTDVAVDLYKRPKIANDNKADLFI